MWGALDAALAAAAGPQRREWPGRARASGRAVLLAADRHCLATGPTGGVRVSGGLASDFFDVETFLDLARGFP